MKERMQILEMLAQGKITAAEADDLLAALSAPQEKTIEKGKEQLGSSTNPKYLRIEVNANKEGKEDKVNIRVPFMLLRAGMKMAAFLPKTAQEKIDAAFVEKGIDFQFGKLNGNSLEEFVQQLSDLSIEVDGKDGDKVRIYCE